MQIVSLLAWLLLGVWNVVQCQHRTRSAKLVGVTWRNGRGRRPIFATRMRGRGLFFANSLDISWPLHCGVIHGSAVIHREWFVVDGNGRKQFEASQFAKCSSMLAAVTANSKGVGSWWSFTDRTRWALLSTDNRALAAFVKAINASATASSSRAASSSPIGQSATPARPCCPLPADPFSSRRRSRKHLHQ